MDWSLNKAQARGARTLGIAAVVVVAGLVFAGVVDRAARDSGPNFWTNDGPARSWDSRP